MPEITQQTPEELAASRKAREDAINKRVEELKSCEGKWYLPNNAEGIRAQMPIRVVRYIGIHVVNGVATYFFNVEIKGHNNWNVPATDFLNDCHEIAAPESNTTATNLPR